MPYYIVEPSCLIRVHIMLKKGSDHKSSEMIYLQFEWI